MEKDRFLHGLDISTNHQVFEKPENRYVTARTIELSCLLEFLLENGWIKQENLEGPVIDLGTGNGVGLLALRQFTLGYLVGVDRYERSYYNGYSGSSKVSTQEIFNTAIASFRKQDIYDFLKTFPLKSASLVTAFYANGWPGLNEIVVEIGKILKPGGQFLFTADQCDISEPVWADESILLRGRGGKESLTLVIPVPDWVNTRYQGRLDSYTKCNYLEPEITDTNGSRIGLIRDRRVRVFTKAEYL